jgi:hypothetical protein
MHACSADSSHLFDLTACGVSGNEGRKERKMCFFSVMYEGNNSETCGVEEGRRGGRGGEGEGGTGEEWIVDVEVEVCSEGELAPPEFARGIDLFHDIFEQVNAFQLSYDDVDQVYIFF